MTGYIKGGKKKPPFISPLNCSWLGSYRKQDMQKVGLSLPSLSSQESHVDVLLQRIKELFGNKSTCNLPLTWASWLRIYDCSLVAETNWIRR